MWSATRRARDCDAALAKAMKEREVELARILDRLRGLERCLHGERASIGRTLRERDERIRQLEDTVQRLRADEQLLLLRSQAAAAASGAAAPPPPLGGENGSGGGLVPTTDGERPLRPRARVSPTRSCAEATTAAADRVRCTLPLRCGGSVFDDRFSSDLEHAPRWRRGGGMTEAKLSEEPESPPPPLPPRRRHDDNVDDDGRATSGASEPLANLGGDDEASVDGCSCRGGAVAAPPPRPAVAPRETCAEKYRNWVSPFVSFSSAASAPPTPPRVEPSVEAAAHAPCRSRSASPPATDSESSGRRRRGDEDSAAAGVGYGDKVAAASRPQPPASDADRCPPSREPVPI